MEFGENRWTRSTRNQVNRLSTLTRQLITLARMEESGGEKMVVFSLSDAVREAAAPYEALALAQNRRISLDIAEGVSMKGDEESIRRLVGILLDNAVKYSPSGAAIRVILKQKGKTGSSRWKTLPVSFPTEVWMCCLRDFTARMLPEIPLPEDPASGCPWPGPLSRPTGVRSRRPAGTVCW